ncbi:MAG: MotA/TolQ/ExbB proton channel family protein [candidate division WOR-3 bacterium]|nr:MAG: MotA/TolQ/ExbB proton channel family protein [candidate division WOR-3 bacterium]
MNIFRIFLDSSIAAQTIMVILVIFSVWSWAIFLKKSIEFSRVRRQTKKFLSSYTFHKDIKEWENYGHQLKDNPYGRVLASGLDEFRKLKVRVSAHLMHQKEQHKERGFINELSDNIRLAMERAKIDEITELEASLPTLSTFVSVSPFLGLLGTVWGIMLAFLEIRARGSAHITIVAPGISDALITTVYGLLVAIPALIFHNIFRSRSNKYSGELDKFVSEIYSVLRKELLTLSG